MEIVEAGHIYKPISLDGENGQLLTFVKRTGVNYPGNENTHAGTILQSVLRCCADRVEYLQNQKFCLENILIRHCLRLSVWLLEFRAARQHKKLYLKTIGYAVSAPMCEKCGHTF